MKILVTGATGFVGRHLVTALLGRGHEVTALARDESKARTLPWFEQVQFVACDIHAPLNDDQRQFFAAHDVLAHLAWSGLPNYKSLFHIDRNLPADFTFLKSLVEAGLGHVLVTGTCFEYGMQSGCLDEELETSPANPYALAKDSLRKLLQTLQKTQPFRLQWARLFYMYGEGQNPNSLLAQLDRSLSAGDAQFNMSGGEQLRDYLSVDDVAQCLVGLIEHADADGVFNVCSGRPVSVRKLVEQHIAARAAAIELRLGHYPYPDHEPMEFWGSNRKFLGLNEKNGQEHA